MTDDDFELDTEDFQRRMTGAVNALRKEFSTLRTGRASSAMVESIPVEAYGSVMPLSQCASINVPEPRLISINVWDKNLIVAVTKAIQESGLGIQPVGEGTVIRLPIPELNEERRTELSKTAARQAEDARIAARNVRRDGMDQLRRAKAEGLSEDEVKLWSDDLQELTDRTIAEIDDALENKRAEIMAI
ncbi:MAG: ribosome recycling factor [Rhodobacteraceae bacterium]|nr:ribosome recycling factor [Paracoccaceae bacterium]